MHNCYYPDSEQLPFPLAYLDWVKQNKPVTDISQTERRDWIREFYESESWNQKPVNGFDLAVAMGYEV